MSARLLRAELAKLRTTRLAPGLLALAVFFVLLGVIATLIIGAVGPGGAGNGADLADPDVVRGILGGATGANPIFAVLGVVLVTGEFRHGTITATFLAEPRRVRVVVAKVAAGLLVGLLFGAVCEAAALVAGLPGLALVSDAAHLPGGEIALVVLGTCVAASMWTALGVAAGALMRNQVAAIVTVLLWTVLAEQLVVQLLPEFGRFLPGGAASSLARVGLDQLLPMAPAALLLAGYVAVATLAAVRVVERRDVT